MKKATWTKHGGEWMIRSADGEEGETVIVQKRGAGAEYHTLGERVAPDTFRVAGR